MLARRRRRLGTLSKRSEFSRTFNSDIRKVNYLTAGHPQNTLHQLRCCLGSSMQSTKGMGLKSWANIFISVFSQISDNKLFWNMIVPWTINYWKNTFSTWIWLKMKAPPPKPPTTTPIARPCFLYMFLFISVFPRPVWYLFFLHIFITKPCWKCSQLEEHGNSPYFWGTKPSPSAWWGWEQCTGQRNRRTHKWPQPMADSKKDFLFSRLRGL